MDLVFYFSEIIFSYLYVVEDRVQIIPLFKIWDVLLKGNSVTTADWELGQACVVKESKQRGFD